MGGIAGAGIYQENSPLIDYRGSGWSRTPWAAGMGGYLSRSKAVGAGANLRFRGSEVVVYSSKGPGRAPVAVTIDGVPRGQFDLAASTEARTALSFGDLPFGIHDISIDLVDEGLILDLDAFEVKAFGAISVPSVPTPPPASTGISMPDIDQVKAWAKKNPILAIGAAFVGARVLLGSKAFKLF